MSCCELREETSKQALSMGMGKRTNIQIFRLLVGRYEIEKLKRPATEVLSGQTGYTVLLNT
jgi:hypothetical protein